MLAHRLVSKDIELGNRKGCLLDEFRKSAHGGSITKRVRDLHSEAAAAVVVGSTLKGHLNALAQAVAHSQVCLQTISGT